MLSENGQIQIVSTCKCCTGTTGSPKQVEVTCGTDQHHSIMYSPMAECSCNKCMVSRVFTFGRPVM